MCSNCPLYIVLNSPDRAGPVLRLLQALFCELHIMKVVREGFNYLDLLEYEACLIILFCGHFVLIVLIGSLLGILVENDLIHE